MQCNVNYVVVVSDCRYISFADEFEHLVDPLVLLLFIAPKPIAFSVDETHALQHLN